MSTTRLTPEQQRMADLWDAHTKAEFQTSNVDDTMATMTDDPYVNHVPVMTGGVGAADVRAFYGRWFIPCQPPDTEVDLISRTVGTDRVVDELIHRFTHTVEMPWLMPGVPPTGKRIEIALVVVVEFRDGKIHSEHIYWDQASVLVQAGVLEPGNLPVAGVEVARKAADVRSVPSNTLIPN